MKNVLNTILRILAGLTALVLFLPVLALALLHDAIHLFTAGIIYLFAAACCKAAEQKSPSFMDVLYKMNVKE